MAAAFELADQIAAHLAPPPRRIVLAAGSAGIGPLVFWASKSTATLSLPTDEALRHAPPAITFHPKIAKRHIHSVSHQ